MYIKWEEVNKKGSMNQYLSTGFIACNCPPGAPRWRSLLLEFNGTAKVRAGTWPLAQGNYDDCWTGATSTEWNQYGCGRCAWPPPDAHWLRTSCAVVNCGFGLFPCGTILYRDCNAVDGLKGARSGACIAGAPEVGRGGSSSANGRRS